MQTINYEDEDLAHRPSFQNNFDEIGAPPGKPKPGTFWADVNDTMYNLKWPNMAACMSWMEYEARTQYFDFVRGYSNKNVHSQQKTFSCSSGSTGGDRKYIKKHPDRERKVPSRKTACPMSLSIKTYPGVDIVLGRYSHTHNHALDVLNLKFVGIPTHVRESLHAMALESRSKASMVSQFHQSVLPQIDQIWQLEAARGGIFSSVPPGQSLVLREELLLPRNIAYYEMKATEKLYRFDKSDSSSVHEWVQRLKAANAVTAYKPRSYVPEPASPFFGLRPDTFLLILQWPWQRELWSQIGSNFMGVDGTHNITKYRNMIFHTIMGRDAFGHGVPIMWMFASNGEEAVYRFFFSTFLANNPVIPSVILTDKDVAQINALRQIFSSSRILLCWWHVLHDWYGRLAVHQHPDAWEMLIRLPRQTTREEHESLWHQLQAILPADFISYMQENWMAAQWLPMWAGFCREGRTIVEKQDTNMIVESYHNFFKTHILNGVRNRRLDFVIFRLMTVVFSHYKTKQLRQAIGMEGEDLTAKARTSADKLGREIPHSDVEPAHSNSTDGGPEDVFFVRSQSDKSVRHIVDIAIPSCSCRGFAAIGIKWCKHLSVVRNMVDERWDGTVADDGLGTSVTEPSAFIVESTFLRDHTVDGDKLTVPAMVPPTNTAATYVTRQLRFLAGSSKSLSQAPDHLLKSLSHALNAVIAHNGQSLPTAEKLPPRIKYSTENVLPIEKATKKSRRVNVDPYGAGEKPGKHAKTPRSSAVSGRQAKAAVSSWNVDTTAGPVAAGSMPLRNPQVTGHPMSINPLPAPPYSGSVGDMHSNTSFSSMHQYGASIPPSQYSSMPAAPQQYPDGLRHVDSWSSLRSHHSLSSFTSSSSYSTGSLVSVPPPTFISPSYATNSAHSTVVSSSYANYTHPYANAIAGPSQPHLNNASYAALPSGDNSSYCILDDYNALAGFF